MKKTIALIDGEHYPPVIKQEIGNRKEIALALLVGGDEKTINGNSDYGVPLLKAGKNLLETLESAIQEHKIERVLDMSGDPILLTHKRFKIAEIALRNFADYEGADFLFEAVQETKSLEMPSMQIIGTGKRVGKTAFSAYACRLLKRSDHDPLVITMGRGGPEKPEIIDGEKTKITPEYLLAQAEKGKHAASDCWEDALTANVLAIGCKRCGSGLSGKTIGNNLAQGTAIANRTGKKFAIIEGSGDIVPSEKCETRLLIIGAMQKLSVLDKYMTPYRYAISDAAFISMCEEPAASKGKIEKIEKIIRKRKEMPIIRTVFRPRPLETIRNERVFLTYTANARILKRNIIPYLEERYECEVTGYSPNLGNRAKLVRDLRKKPGQEDIVLTELKAAGVDTVTREGLARGKRVVYTSNIPVGADSLEETEIQELILELAKKSKERFESR